MIRAFNKLIEYLYFKQKGNLALYDRLTGVYNYNWFNLVANKKYISSAIYVTVIDINNFKEINDTYGHLHGNNILRQVAEQLLFCKEYDDSVNVIRYGGDEFVVLSDSNPKSALDLCIDDSYLISFGIVRTEKYEPLSVAFVKADKEMYEQKKKFKKKHKKRA
jgi:diguanylate cyclase (GGDEF)-like protein